LGATLRSVLGFVDYLSIYAQAGTWESQTPLNELCCNNIAEAELFHSVVSSISWSAKCCCLKAGTLQQQHKHLKAEKLNQIRLSLLGKNGALARA